MSHPTTPRRVAVIMAGGSGERFWPLSRRQRPKQLLHLCSHDETLLQESVSRAARIFAGEDVFIATSSELRDVVAGGDARVPRANVLAEPCRRNTAGCLCWAAAHLMARLDEGADATMAILTADHQIPNDAAFEGVLRACLAEAEAHPALVTIGIPPTRPETGYGYVELAEGEPGPSADGSPSASRVQRFREKPDHATAEQFLASGRFLWNSGMFFWRLSVYMTELERAQPAMATATRKMAGELRAGDVAAAEATFASLQSISVDYALLEKASAVRVVSGAFAWEDVGSWDALERTRPADANGNVAIGDPVLADAHGCIVYNEPGANERAVALVGVEDLVVVVTGDSVLVTRKDRAQDVRKAVEELKRRGASQL